MPKKMKLALFLEEIEAHLAQAEARLAQNSGLIDELRREGYDLQIAYALHTNLSDRIRLLSAQRQQIVREFHSTEFRRSADAQFEVGDRFYDLLPTFLEERARSN